ncbi:hypothetical protein B6S12_06955 [Helicobacter valdiviensis]|uniref:Uncharacterized protein n=1 Tax=Helicobacter valdiviensis TaxID=1458358 RepID=A0A2W6MV71_9HELI|nr:hypothetical protein [Helicobacter valdiviensis]PZT47819.1 hypothetical protein B6S12_06955 [Helicobacter valdiviensis]
MFRSEYDLGTIISAAITFAIVVLAIRLVLFLVNRKKTTIQKPDWLMDERFDLDKKRKRK